MTQQEANSILTALHGQSIVLPNLNAILDGWPREVNQNLDRLRQDVDQWLDRYDIKNSPTEQSPFKSSH